MTVQHNTPNINGTGWQQPRRPGWPMGSTPTTTELAEAAALAVVNAMDVAPSSTVETLARLYIERKGPAAAQAFALALMDRVTK